jgi:hypothetical protein
VTSAPVNVTFLNPPPAGLLVPSGSIWKYYDTVTNEMPGWSELNYDDNAWRYGPAELGYGDAPGRPEATIVEYGPNQNNRYITTYFRHRFFVPDPSIYKSLSARILRDDGAIVYLNGQEIFRSNMGPGPVTINTPALGNASDDGAGFNPVSAFSSGPLVRGLNMLAVEIHQVNGSSSDISFDLEMLGSTTNARPNISIASPADNSVFTESGTINIDVAATDNDGMITNVLLMVNGVKIGESLHAPFNFTWQNVPLGNYSLTAVAIDNQGDTSTSSVVRVFIVCQPNP